MKRARGYVRRSIDDPKKGYSVETQKAFIAARCTDEGWILDAARPYYVDVGGHGWDISRPELKQMLLAAKAHEFDILVVWRQDRLSRTDDVKLLLRALVWWGVAVCMGDQNGIAENEGTLNLLLAGIKTEVSEEELRKMRKAVKDGQARARIKGKSIGRRPAGFALVNSKLQFNELGQRALAYKDLSVRKFAAALDLPLKRAYELQQNIRAFEAGDLGDLMTKRTHAARDREARAEERAQKKRAETIAWLVEIVPAKFGR